MRLRITAGALLVVALVCCGAGLIVLHRFERELVGEIDTTLRANTDFINRSLTHGTPLPTQEGPTDLYVQFLNDDGKVVGASSAAKGLAPFLAPNAVPGPEIKTVHASNVGDLRVLAERVPNDRSITLIVARSAATVGRLRTSLTRLLIATLAAASAILGVLIWKVVGRALRPVEAMRRTADAISEAELDRRLDAPATGDELDRLAETLNEMLDRLESAMTRERRFIADASHELRTPIAAVRALLETEPADPAGVRQIRADSLAQLGHLQNLVTELLELARIEDEEHTTSTAPVDLDDLVLLQARQLERTTTLHIDTTNVSGGQVAGRDADLGRLVENLATNAARYARTTVAFSVRHVDGVVEFIVADDGPGISAADRTRVFERFSTLDESRRRGARGTGLGLSIASAIAKAHRGSIRADDSTLEGAAFVVELPAC